MRSPVDSFYRALHARLSVHPVRTSRTPIGIAAFYFGHGFGLNHVLNHAPADEKPERLMERVDNAHVCFAIAVPGIDPFGLHLAKLPPIGVYFFNAMHGCSLP